MENTVFQCIDFFGVRSVVLQKYFMYILYIYIYYDSLEGGTWQNANDTLLIWLLKPW